MKKDDLHIKGQLVGRGKVFIDQCSLGLGVASRDLFRYKLEPVRIVSLEHEQRYRVREERKIPNCTMHMHTLYIVFRAKHLI